MDFTRDVLGLLLIKAHIFSNVETFDFCKKKIKNGGKKFKIKHVHLNLIFLIYHAAGEEKAIHKYTKKQVELE